MKTSIAIALAAIVGAAAVPVAQADTNVAYLANVTSFGSGIGDLDGATWGGGLAALQTVTDGEYVPIGQQWNFGSVYWSGADTGLTITLSGAASINSLALQADNNDNYRIQYLDRGNVWHELITAQTNQTVGGLETYGGMLPAPVVATAFRIYGIGDNHYGVAEFQAIGNFVPAAPVPEPSTYAMLLGGLGLMGLVARRRSS